MNTPKENNSDQHWYAKAFYYNRSDARLIVPKRLGAGVTLNFAHPKIDTILCWTILLAAILPLTVIVLVKQHALLAAHPAALLWMGAAFGAAVAAAFINRTITCSGRPLRHITFGLCAVCMGFGIQTIFNYPVAVMAGVHITWRTHIYFALIAALAQTGGKFQMLKIAKNSAGTSRQYLANALWLGLGFALAEIFFIDVSSLMHGIVPYGIAYVWERSAAAVFHIYSCGLLAAYIIRPRKYLLAAVLGIHFLTDWLAGANHTLTHFGLFGLECVFSVCAVLIWSLFLALPKESAEG